jgi:1,4-dihydroxy-2-naphthoate octaprenyltransferase
MKRTVRLWWQAVRPFSFTVSVLPPILGALLAVMENADIHFHWLHFLLTVSGCVLAHSAANLLSDYYDYKNRVDREETYGSSRVLVEKTMTPDQVFRGSMGFLAVAALIGLYFVVTLSNGPFLMGLILVGGFLGVFYTARPFRLKYNALGDIAVFIWFGSAMTLGAYFVQAERFSWTPVVYALPLGLLVDAILHGNNLRDVDHDRVAKIRTVPIVIGKRGATHMYSVLVLGAYVLTLALVIVGDMPAIVLVACLSLPLAVKLAQRVYRMQAIPAAEFATIDADTAKLHTLFGALFIGSLLVHYLLIGP